LGCSLRTDTRRVVQILCYPIMLLLERTRSSSQSFACAKLRAFISAPGFLRTPYFRPPLRHSTRYRALDPFWGMSPFSRQATRFRRYPVTEDFSPVYSALNCNRCQLPLRTLRVTKSHLCPIKPANRFDSVPCQSLSRAVTPLRALRGDGLLCHLPVYLPVTQQSNNSI